MAGGGGSSNSAAVAEQRAAAAEARQKEEARKLRLEGGTAQINSIYDAFHNNTDPAAQLEYDKALKAFDAMPDKVVTGYEPLPDGTTGPQAPLISDPRAATNYFAENGRNPEGWLVFANGSDETGESRYGPAEKVWNYDQLAETRKGAPIYGANPDKVRPEAPTPREGPNFFETYRGAHDAYYMPQLEDQYSDARDELTFNLARAGTLRSSMAGDAVGDLVEQNALNRALLRSKGDAATATLRQRVQQEKSSAINQLYATESPEVGVNSALAAVRTLQQETPDFNPLGQLFQVAAQGAMDFGQGRADQQYANVVTTGSPFRSAGRTIL